MAVKSISTRIEEEMLTKIGYVADFEDVHGTIAGTIQPDVNVKPSGKHSLHDIIRPEHFRADVYIGMPLGNYTFSLYNIM